MSNAEKFQLRLASIGAAATILAAAIGALVQLGDDPAGPSTTANCAAIVLRVAELADRYPEVADLYARDVPGLPELADERQVEECGAPRALLMLLARSKSPRD